MSPVSSTRPAGTPAVLQGLHGVLRIAIAGPVGDHLVELVVAGLALGEAQAGEVVAADHGAARPPLVVGHHRDHDPLVVTGAPVRALRRPAVGRGCRGGAGVVAPRSDAATNASPAEHGGPLALGQVDVGALAGAVPLGQGEGDRRRRRRCPPTGSPYEMPVLNGSSSST